MPTTKKPTQEQIDAAFRTLALGNRFDNGDIVKVTTKFWPGKFGESLGGDNSGYLNLKLGKEYKITDFDEFYGEYELNNDVYVPFYALELVRKSDLIKLNDEYEAEISKDGKKVIVGCQDISVENVIKLAEAIKSFKPAVVKKKATKKATKKRVY